MTETTKQKKPERKVGAETQVQVPVKETGHLTDDQLDKVSGGLSVRKAGGTTPIEY